MKKILQSAVLAVSLLTGAATQAAVYEFSYQFNNSKLVTGTFEGEADGDLIRMQSNLEVWVNGVSFGMAAFGMVNPVMSADISKNNFSLRSSWFGPGNSFEIAPSFSGNNETRAFLMFRDVLSSDIALASTLQPRWQIAVVPEPQTYAMLLAGLATVGFVARRRRQV